MCTYIAIQQHHSVKFILYLMRQSYIDINIINTIINIQICTKTTVLGVRYSCQLTSCDLNYCKSAFNLFAIYLFAIPLILVFISKIEMIRLCIS